MLKRIKCNKAKYINKTKNVFIYLHSFLEPFILKIYLYTYSENAPFKYLYFLVEYAHEVYNYVYSKYYKNNIMLCFLCVLYFILN